VIVFESRPALAKKNRKAAFMLPQRRIDQSTPKYLGPKIEVLFEYVMDRLVRVVPDMDMD